MEHVNYQYHKFAGYILFPVRLLTLVTSTLLTIGSISLLDCCGCKTIGKSVLLQYGKLTSQLLGLTIHSEGIENLTDKPCIIVGNHINLYDHYVMLNTLRNISPYIVSNKFNIRPINIIFNFMKCINTEDKKGSIIEKMKERIKEGDQITIYPDGCNPIPDGKLIAPFKNGAFVPKAPIQPIVIRYVPSSNTNMNWYYEDSSKDNTLFSLLKSYLQDGDMHVYVKVLPLQHYKDSYKSHEDYRDDIYELMTKELSTLPEQTPKVTVYKPSTEIMMKHLNYLLYVFLFSFIMSNTLFACFPIMNYIAGYFCHFYPTKNTILLDMISISYTITKTSLLSVQNQYDLYFRYVYLIFVVSRGYKYLQYKDEIPFPEMKHIKNIWIPGYTFALYPLFLNTLELYNLI
jgi:1-acyl-sn-glycerol-3-phosphate acyltransferase